MKDKRRKYDLSYFMKYRGGAKDTSPSVNASELNSEEIKRRNNNLNRELREMENPEENARNNSFVYQEGNNTSQPANQVNNSNNDNNENKGNSRETFTEPKNEEEVVSEEPSREQEINAEVTDSEEPSTEPEIQESEDLSREPEIQESEDLSRQAQINAEIAASENRLDTLMQQFSLESRRNRPDFDTTLANINSPGAAAMNRAFEVNNKRRQEQEKAELKKEREVRRREKEEGVEANTAIEKKRVQGQSASQKAPTKEERADRFFYLITTSTRPHTLSSNQLYQFSQNPLNYIEWARRELLTPSHRTEFRNMSTEQLLTRLPRNLQILFEQIRSERNRLISLQKSSEILRLRPISAPVLPSNVYWKCCRCSCI